MKSWCRRVAAVLVLLGAVSSACEAPPSTRPSVTGTPSAAGTRTVSDVTPTARHMESTMLSLTPSVVAFEATPSVSADGSPPPENVTETATIDASSSGGSPAAGKDALVLAGHTDAVVSAEYSHDGALMVTGSNDGTAILWDAAAGTQIALLAGHTQPLTSARFDGGAERIVTASYDGTARVWETARGEDLAVLLGHAGILNGARFDATGARVVTAGDDGTTRVWNLASGEQILVLDNPGVPVIDAMFSPDGSQIATANADGTVRIWDAEDGSPLFVLPDAVLHGQSTNLAVRAIAYTPGGDRVISSGDDGTLKVWDVYTGAAVLDVNAHGRGITLSDVSHDGERVATASFFGGVAVTWDVPTGSQLAKMNQGSIINDVAISPDGETVATVGTDGVLYLWEAASGQMLGAFEGHAGPIYTVGFHPTARQLVTASADGTARIWNAGSVEPDTADGTPGGNSAALSDYGPWWVVAGQRGMWIANADGSGVTNVSEGAFDPQGADLAHWIAPEGAHLAFLTAHDQAFDAALHIISLPSLTRVLDVRLTSDATEPSPGSQPGDPAFDGATVILQDDSLAWSPDGRWLAFLGMIDGPTSDLYVYDTVADEITRLTDGPTQAVTPAWSPDGRTILHAGLEGANIDTGMHVQTFWAAAPDDPEVRLVQSGEQQFVGWTGSGEMLFYSIDTICGAHDLRAVSLDGAVQPIWEGYLNRVALDPEGGSVLVALWKDTASSEFCHSQSGQGLYLTSAGGVDPIRIVEDIVSEMEWSSQAELFFGRTDYGMLAVSRSGEFIDLAVPAGAHGLPDVVPSTRDLLWSGDGLWVGALTSSVDDPPRQIFPQRTVLAQWAPDGSHLLFITAAGALYRAGPPGYVPEYIAEVGIASAAVSVAP